MDLVYLKKTFRGNYQTSMYFISIEDMKKVFIAFERKIDHEVFFLLNQELFYIAIHWKTFAFYGLL